MSNINERKKQIVIHNYFKTDCDVDTTIREAYTKGFERGLAKAPKAPSIEIVRCSECKHRFDCFSQVAMTNKHQTTTLYQDIDFCSYGERSE